MQKHSEIGERILAKVASYAEIASIVDTIMSASMGVAIPTDLLTKRSRFFHESSPSLTPITR